MFYPISSSEAGCPPTEDEEPVTWRNDHVCDIQLLPGWLSLDECSSLKALASELPWRQGELRDASRDARESDCAWMEWSAETRWLYEKLATTFMHANRTYRFDLRGMNESPQLLRYRAGGSLAWHHDVGLGGASVRKLALVALVDCSADCTGGALQFCSEREIDVAMRPGSAVIFPPFLAHRVTSISEGSRLSMAAWAVGPSFC